MNSVQISQERLYTGINNIQYKKNQNKSLNLKQSPLSDSVSFTGKINDKIKQKTKNALVKSGIFAAILGRMFSLSACAPAENIDTYTINQTPATTIVEEIDNDAKNSQSTKDDIEILITEEPEEVQIAKETEEPVSTKEAQESVKEQAPEHTEPKEDSSKAHKLPKTDIYVIPLKEEDDKSLNIITASDPIAEDIGGIDASDLF